MKQPVDQPTGGTALLANGSSGGWDIAVDEALDREEWFLEIDGPQAYLVFQLRELEVLPAALRFLQASPKSSRANRRHKERGGKTLVLGRFGSASVSLVWDDELPPRCFLVVGPKARSTLRLTLQADDVSRVTEALRQVTKDIPQAYPGKQAPHRTQAKSP
ncbi:MAG: hypothetical protein L0Z62_05235 [Gemmataceae bacterium]|nr:hypothetical protein [Gemmataceae bacterium]